MTNPKRFGHGLVDDDLQESPVGPYVRYDDIKHLLEQSKPGAEMTKPITELQWIRALILERQREDHDIPTWLALEWVDEAIKRSASEPTEKRSVFVLHMGDYERRHIHSVHSSTEKATEVAKRVMHDWKTPEEPDIDEHEVDPDLCLKCGYEESNHTEYPQTWKHQFVSSRSAVNRTCSDD